MLPPLFDVLSWSIVKTQPTHASTHLHAPSPMPPKQHRWHPSTWDAGYPAGKAAASQMRQMSYFGYCYNLWLFGGILVDALVCMRIVRYMRIHPGLKAFYQVRVHRGGVCVAEKGARQQPASLITPTHPTHQPPKHRCSSLPRASFWISPCSSSTSCYCWGPPSLHSSSSRAATISSCGSETD